MIAYNMSGLIGINEIDAQTGVKRIGADGYFMLLSGFTQAAPGMIAGIAPDDLRDDPGRTIEILSELQGMLIGICALHPAWRIERLTQTINNGDWIPAAVLLETAREQVNSLAKKISGAEMSGPTAASAGETASENGGKPVILVVDDSAQVLNTVKAMLKARYNVYGALNHENALNFLSGSQPDLIIMDMDMPNMDGYTLLSLIKKLPAHKNTPVLFLVGGAAPESLEMAKSLGVSDFIEKPVDLFKLVSGIDAHIKRER